jgi:sec-independent protein translocase protein TatA
MDIFAPWHLLIILLIVLVIFGPRKLGDAGSALGRAVRDFKKIVHDQTDVSENRGTVAETRRNLTDKEPPKLS